LELVTGGLRLSLLDLDRDVAYLHVAYADPLVMSRWLYEDASASVTETRDRLAARLALEDAQMFVVCRAGEDVALGLVERIGATSPPGVGWMLRRDAWGQGIMSEAAAAVVEHLLGVVGLDRVEAWADTNNVASIKVARRCGLTERGRLARSDREGRRHESIVLGRYREERPQDLYAAEVVLPVRDVATTLGFLRQALGCETDFVVGDPMIRAGIRFGPWSSSRGLQLTATEDTVHGITVYVHCGAPADRLYADVQAAGGRTDAPPASTPWGRVEFNLRLPEGHVLCISSVV
jgi:RimJ/RimL family protein N-acetyltransferase/uncharacterized glyoxalase superfamily protein PhnB